VCSQGLQVESHKGGSVLSMYERLFLIGSLFFPLHLTDSRYHALARVTMTTMMMIMMMERAKLARGNELNKIRNN
jgi:hypothetical protein